jgi:hypothetical protein
MIPLGERHFRRAMHEFVEHYHRERNHQGLDNELIDGQPSAVDAGRIRRRQRLGGCSTTTTVRPDAVACRFGRLMGYFGRGWIEGKWIEKAGQRRRRYYKITPPGHKVLGEQRENWRELLVALQRVAGITSSG